MPHKARINLATECPDLISILPTNPHNQEQGVDILTPPLDSAAPSRAQRRVLIVEDEPSIRNVLYVLLASLGCEGEVAQSGHQALAMIRRETFDAVLLDLRCSDVPAKEVVAEIREIQPNLLGRVLVITGEVADPQTLEFVEHYCVPVIPRSRVMQEMWTYLQPVLGFTHG